MMPSRDPSLYGVIFRLGAVWRRKVWRRKVWHRVDRVKRHDEPTASQTPCLPPHHPLLCACRKTNPLLGSRAWRSLCIWQCLPPLWHLMLTARLWIDARVRNLLLGIRVTPWHPLSRKKTLMRPNRGNSPIISHPKGTAPNWYGTTLGAMRAAQAVPAHAARDVALPISFLAPIWPLSGPCLAPVWRCGP